VLTVFHPRALRADFRNSRLLAMFDITTSQDYLAKLEADFGDFMEAPHSARLAFNCATTAYHLHEWVWGDWLHNDYTTWQQLKIRDLRSFKAWIDVACPWFDTIRQLTVGVKHFGAAPNFKACTAVEVPQPDVALLTRR
jgi:hypothetical protein